MSVETATSPPQLNTAWPLPADFISEGDDHIRVTKTVIKTTFANITAPVTVTHTELNYLAGATALIQPAIDAKAPIASPTFTGTVVLPSTTSIGPVTSTEIGYVDGVTAPIQPQIDAKGALAGQAWTGAQDFTGATHTTATQALGTNNTRVASTAFTSAAIAAAAFSSSLPSQAGNTNKVITTDGTNASWQWPNLPVRLISTSGAALVGWNNVITVGGITVTMPTTPAARDQVEITNASNTETPVLDWGTAPLRGQASPGLMTLDSKNAVVRSTYTNATQGWL